MVDFLKAFPFVSMDDYRWKLSVPYIRLMSVDNTRVHYLSDEQIKRKNATVINSVEELVNDFGIPIDMLDKSKVVVNNN